MNVRLLLALACACAAGCTSTPLPPWPASPPPVPLEQPGPLPPPPPDRPGSLRLACESGESLGVRLLGDEAHVSGLGADLQVLLRDAGGVTPQQAVFSNRHWRAEFGIGADGRGAVLEEIEGARRTLRCRRP